MLTFEINNQRMIQIAQTSHDGAVTVTTLSAEKDGIRKIESEYKIRPCDMVSLLNWFRYQKENGNPDLLF